MRFWCIYSFARARLEVISVENLDSSVPDAHAARLITPPQQAAAAGSVRV